MGGAVAVLTGINLHAEMLMLVLLTLQAAMALYYAGKPCLQHDRFEEHLLESTLCLLCFSSVLMPCSAPYMLQKCSWFARQTRLHEGLK